MAKWVYIREIGGYVGQEVTLKGLGCTTGTDKGKLQFLVIRDGTGFIQAVAFQKELPAEVFQRAASLTQESSVVVTGVVREDPRAPGGYELGITNVEIIQLVQDYPIALKEHGVEFLMANPAPLDTH